MSVRVVARIRPLLEKEQDKEIIVRADSAEPGKAHTIVKIPNPRNGGEEFSFAFNGVYDEGVTQETLFNAEVAPHIKSLFQGYDVTIFAYGVTGTGKTHTMRGGLKLADRGVIPRLLSGVFRRGKKIQKDSPGDTFVTVALSYYEIYNDKVFDLLEPPEKRTPSGLPLRAEANGKTVVAGLTERPCEDLKDFEKMYIEANNNRVTAATKLNAHSSRSHAILRVKLTQINGDQIKESTASAIDLAGSEDNRRTDNGKERLVESAAINKSLFVLSQCINAISNGDKRIPYRESKMTRILSLGQNHGITVMILNLAPLKSYHLDTLSSLNVSSRAKRIEVREIENEVVFKHMPKQGSHVAVLGAQQRQALKSLAAVQKAHTNGAAKAETNRPVKAFTVFPDKAKPTAIASPTKAASPAKIAKPLANTSQVRRSTSHKKRHSEEEPAARPVKIPRPGLSAPIPQKSVTVSEAQIEALVEKKVSEILAARAAAEASAVSIPAQPGVSEAVQKRLEALERRIDSDEWKDDAKSEGLRFLLAGRQAKERGDDATALKMYENALPYFPGQAKLLGKIERLRARLSDTTAASPVRTPRRQRRRKLIDEDGYNASEADTEEDPSPKVKSRRAPRPVTSTPSKSRPKTLLSDDDPATPRTQQLLDIVNSRELIQIRGLVGFGAKKTQDLVDYLEMVQGEGESAVIGSLAELRAVPGVGGRTVERAYAGLVVQS